MPPLSSCPDGFLKKHTALLWDQLDMRELSVAEGPMTVVNHILPAASEHEGGAWPLKDHSPSLYLNFSLVKPWAKGPIKLSESPDPQPPMWPE